MVKFGRNKFKALNKIVKKQNAAASPVTNKVLKKKINAEKKVTFQKEVLIKEVVADDSLVRNVSKKDLILNVLLKEAPKPAKKNKPNDESENKPKLKHVKKQKARQKMQIIDTKLLLNLMKNK